MNAQQQIEYYNQHPPNSLAKFMAQPTSLGGIEFDGHGFSGKYPDSLIKPLNIVFKVGCNCGGQTYSLLAESVGDAFYYHKGFVSADSFYLRCTSCGKQTLLFDPLLHGYNAESIRIGELDDEENDANQSQDSSNVQPKEYRCRNCGNRTLEVFARFEYSSDLFEGSAFANRTQEFFSWFSVITKCSECSSLSTPVDCECA